MLASDTPNLSLRYTAWDLGRCFRYSHREIDHLEEDRNAVMQHGHDDAQDGSEQDDENICSPNAKRRKTTHSGDGLLAREMGLMRDGRGKSSATFLGSASGIHFIRSVYGAIGTPTAHGTSSENDLVPGEDDRLPSESTNSRQQSIWQSDEVQNHSSVTTSFDELVEWTESYFDLWHPTFPFLHAPSVLENLETISQGKISRLQPADITVIKAIMSLSLADRRQTKKFPAKTPPKHLVFYTFDECMECIQPALARPSTISSLQAVVCVQLFLVSMLRLNAASRIGGLVAQMAFQLGLHRCPTRYKSFSTDDQLLRKRLFWSIYCIEKYVSQALGLPLTLRDEDIDVCHLNKEQHHSSDRKASPLNRDDRLQLLAFLAQHAQIRGAIVELRNKRIEERDRSPDTAIFITARLTQWWNEVEDFLDQLDSIQISSLHRTILETVRHESIIMLNRPLLALPKHTANYANAIQACIGAAKALITSLSIEADKASADKPLVWPSFTWAAWMSAFILLYGAAEGKVTHAIAVRNVDRSLTVLARLASRGSVWPQACAVAIEDLKSVLDQRYGVPAHVLGQSPTQSTSVQSISHREHISSRNNGHDNQMSSIASQMPPAEPTSSDRADMSHNSVRWDSSVNSQANKLDSTLAPNNPSQGRDYNQEYWSANNQDSSNLLSAFLLNSVTSDSSSFGSMHPTSVPPMALGEIDPFQGFDIPFWFGQDNYLAWAGEKG